MSIKIAINGFGRIGRMTLRSLYEYNYSNFEVIAINASGSPESCRYLLQYDSLHGKFPHKILLNNDFMNFSGNNIKLISEMNVNNLPWKDLNIDLVYECTGSLKNKTDIKNHLSSGAKKVLISSDFIDSNKTIVYGVNHKIINKQDQIISNASCTTNCAALIIEALYRVLDIEYVNFITVHAYTSDQLLVDNNHKDLCRSRAAGINIIPTSTNLSNALVKIFPHLSGKITSLSTRVPVANVSYLISTICIKNKIKLDKLNKILIDFVNYTQSNYSKETNCLNGSNHSIIEYTYDSNVSMDFNHCSASAIIDLVNTKIISENLIQVYAWYDNEWGYSCRMHDVAKKMFECNDTKFTNN